MSHKIKPEKKRSKSSPSRELNPAAIRQAIIKRAQRRSSCAGAITVPAVPGLLDHYVEICATVFKAVGREFNEEQVEHARSVLAEQLTKAYAGSVRSNIVITYDAPAAGVLNYRVAPEVTTVAAAYESWITTRKPPLFGNHPDARVMDLATEFEDVASCPVLDIGAGTGRNALALARRGYPVDAVEMTPKFAEMLRSGAEKENLHLRVIERNLFESVGDLGREYKLILLSEVASDFGDVEQFRRMFEITAGALTPGGILVFNVHLGVQGYTPDKATRELAQQCYSAIFTRNELAQAEAGLGLERIADDAVLDYEKEHLPPEAWPPTGWYVEWVSGQDVFYVEPGRCPAEMRWLVYRKVRPSD